MDYNNLDHGPVGPDADGIWQHLPDWAEFGTPYCPRCACQTAGYDDDRIIIANYEALAKSSVAVLDLRTHSIGTPVEMYWRVWLMERPAILIAKEGSVFIRVTAKTWPNIVSVVPHVDAAIERLAEVTTRGE